jgi:hypothetical protein
METFRYSFRESVEIVRQSSLCLAPFVEGGNCLVLRYEDNFTGDLRTVYRIAEWLDRGLADDVVAEIFDSLTPLRVRQRLNDLVREAVFAGEDTRTEIEPGTNWHFDHLGEGTVGRSLARFDRGHLIAIDYALREVLPVLGYSAVTAPDIVEPGMEISFREGGLGAGYLGEGFGALEHWGVDGCRYSTDLASFADLDRASDFSSFDVASVSCIDEDLNRGSENPYQRSPGGNDRSRR